MRWVALVAFLFAVAYGVDSAARAYGCCGYAKKRGGYVDRDSWEWCKKRYPGKELQMECYRRKEGSKKEGGNK